MMSDPETPLKLSSRVRYRAVGEDGVLVHLNTGRVVVVNQVGLHIVTALANKVLASDLLHSLVASFDVTEAQALNDLKLFMAELGAEQMLEPFSSVNHV